MRRGLISGLLVASSIGSSDAMTGVKRPLAASTPQASMSPSLSPAAAVLSFQELATIPKPGSQGLGMVRFSPDDRYVTYLGSSDAASLTRQLYVYDRQTREASLVIAPAEGSGEEKTFSKEEALRRERARIMSTGVTEYSWAKKAERILVPMDSCLFVQDGVGEGKGATWRRLFDPAAFPAVGTGPLLDAKLSDDGERVFFVWGDELCAADIVAAADGCVPRRLTFGARGSGVTNGLADYCAQEEMDRYTGYWSSPGGGDLVAYEQVDERHVPLFTIMNQGVDTPHEQTEQHRYPFAGAANPAVKLGVAQAAGAVGGGEVEAPVVWFDLTAPFGTDFYLARVMWMVDGQALLVQVQSRDQRSLAMLRCDVGTGSVTTLLTEQSETWINLHDLLAPINGGSELLWASERDGWRHLYVHSAADGGCLRQLTQGAWAVEVDGCSGLIERARRAPERACALVSHSSPTRHPPCSLADLRRSSLLWTTPPAPTAWRTRTSWVTRDRCARYPRRTGRQRARRSLRSVLHAGQCVRPPPRPPCRLTGG